MPSIINKVFVVNSGAISSGANADPTVLTDGELGFFDVGEGGTNAGINISAATPVLDDYKKVMVHQRQGSLWLNGGILEVSKIKRIVKKAYAAATAQVTTIPAAEITAVPAEGGSYILTIENVTQRGERPQKRQTYVLPYDAGASYVLADFVALINADEDADVVASAPGADLVLTGKIAGVGFVNGYDGIWVGAADVLTTAPSEGIGTYNLVSTLEAHTLGSVGEYYEPSGLQGPYPNDPIGFTYPKDQFKFAVVGKTYAMYTIEYLNNMDKAINNSMETREVTLAVDTSVTNEAEMEAFFVPYMVTL